MHLLRAGLVTALSWAVVPAANALCAARVDSSSEQAAWTYPIATADADFDGDNKPDLAIGSTRGLGYIIEIRFSTQLAKTYLTLANGGVGTRIFACDVDRDSFLDLVVTSSTSLLPIAVYLGDGKGHFQEGKPWTLLPFHLDTPYRFKPSSASTTFVSLMPQTRFSFYGGPDCVLSADLVAGAWLTGKYSEPEARRHPANRKPRSPPLSIPC
ncbi:MAG TPA: VCBS repeat-containing protein [Acidobacteriota bacterium]|nr:VCBS repeat-containing protein [Acidobacteriota bacterium]